MACVRSRVKRLGLTLSLVAMLTCVQAQAQSLAASRPASAPAAGELLNSERIESRFGSYGLEVISSDARLRLSNLYSADGPAGARTTRTLALVEYPPSVPSAVEAEHAAILAGGSIGATFKAGGWRVIKTNAYFGERMAGPALERLMRLDAPARLAVHVYRLDVARDGLRLPYARIVEVHHPEYLTPDAVRAIYAPGWRDGDNEDVRPLLAELDALGY